MKKTTIYIGLEFIFGPIQKLHIDENGNEVTGIPLIDKNERIQQLDKQINDLWCSLYTEDKESPDGLKFDKNREKVLAPQLLKMIEELINRLNAINDGSFTIHDMITDYLKSLI